MCHFQNSEAIEMQVTDEANLDKPEPSNDQVQSKVQNVSRTFKFNMLHRLKVEDFELEMTCWRKFRLVFTNFRFGLFLTMLTWLLYHFDILSDVLQMHTLKENCHYAFFGCSIAILVVSFMVTAVYVKYHFNVSWFEAISYMRKFE